jgi:CHAT domain-containing protein
MADKATKAAFVGAAPRHAYMHLATHGFFADEAERSALAPDLRSGAFRLDRAVSGRYPGVMSGVVFAGINRPPGGAVEGCLLVALEAEELDLRAAELVTLSACDTGSGRTAGGEGVLGLQRAFLVAGARAVLASQWRVPDRPTQALMQEFYKRLWGKDLVSKAEALRQAQALMIERWDGPSGTFRSGTKAKGEEGPLSPYLWAAFTLAGDWR